MDRAEDIFIIVLRPPFHNNQEILPILHLLEEDGPDDPNNAL